MKPWLHIIGIGDDGIGGLHPSAQRALKGAQIIIGGSRHLAMLAPHSTAQQINWPSPFDALLDQVRQMQGQQVAVLVSGDPLWYSAGSQFIAAFEQGVQIYCHISAFQLAAARMGWPLERVKTISLHGAAYAIFGQTSCPQGADFSAKRRAANAD